MVHVHSKSTLALLPIGRSQQHPMTPHLVCASGLDALDQSLQDRRDHPSSPPYKHRYPKINDSQVGDPNNLQRDLYHVHAEWPTKRLTSEFMLPLPSTSISDRNVHGSGTSYCRQTQSTEETSKQASRVASSFAWEDHSSTVRLIYLTASVRDAGSSNVFK
jgi:hypothetical protein